MGDKSTDAQNKISDRENTAMSMAFTVDDAKVMGSFLLSKEFRGPGDTIEAAAGRIETNQGVPATLLLRLRNRDVNDMYLSSFSVLAAAYVRAKTRIDKAYEHERSLAVHSKITRLADFVSGSQG